MKFGSFSLHFDTYMGLKTAENVHNAIHQLPPGFSLKLNDRAIFDIFDNILDHFYRNRILP